MSLTKEDIKDATLLLKAGNVDAARRILRSSNDPRAIALLAKFEARFPSESRVAQPNNDLTEVKRLIMQKKFDAAETLLRASNHPHASRLLQKIAIMKSTARPIEKSKPQPRARSVWKYISVMLSGFLSSSN
jgi:hypothetical protein